MFLTLATTHRPATDLGFLLHKHPERPQSFPVSAGTAHVFYPRADEQECTAALLVELDPIALVRDRRGGLSQYVNDRPYAAGSALAVALRTVFGTAMSGRCDAKPELAARQIPLTVRVPSLSAPGGPDLVARMFAPLGWTVSATAAPLDPEFPEWGPSRTVDLTLTGTLRLADALRHLYVLLPALDGAKHYWVDQAEADKLLRMGEGWLAGHPERDLITARYLVHHKPFIHYALDRLTEAESPATDEPVVTEAPDQPQPLAAQRRGTVLATLRAAGARRVLDLGCGPGALLTVLVAEPSFTEIVGLDVSARALDTAARTLKLDRLPERTRQRLTLRQSALTYADPSLAGYDAAVLMEVIEHLDQERLPALEHAVFTVAHPTTVVVTTPNAEYNVRFDGLARGALRHGDHRFEWTRAQFRDWATEVAARRGYRVRFLPVGVEDQELGPPTQLAVFDAAEVTV